MRVQPHAGEPIAKSPSPALHTAGFTSCGLLHTYALHPATDATSVSKILGDDAFGGASVTIPLKVRQLDAVIAWVIDLN